MAQKFIEIRSGLEVTVADGVELPQALYKPAGKSAPSSVDGPTKDELKAQAEELGIKVPSKASKDAIAALIAEHAAKAVEESEEQREAAPEGVAPGTETGE